MKMPDPIIPDEIPREELPSLLVNWHFGPKARRYMSRRRFAEVTDSLGGVRRGRALDVGCGWGYNLFLLRDLGFEPFGIDIVQNDFPAARRIAEANGIELRLAGADVSHLPFKSGSFDAVTSVETLEHVFREDRGDAFDEIARVLAVGGRLSLSTPNYDSLVERGKRFITRIPVLKRLFPPMCYPAGHVSRADYHPYSYHDPLTREEIEQLLRASGFEEISFGTIIFVLKNTPDLLVPLVRPIEALLEHLPGLRRLGSTLVVRARKIP
jgi:ubiquinone/menaquinone biosynthesis C-methylase UbiE